MTTVAFALMVFLVFLPLYMFSHYQALVINRNDDYFESRFCTPTESTLQLVQTRKTRETNTCVTVFTSDFGPMASQDGRCHFFAFRYLTNEEPGWQVSLLSPQISVK